MSRYISLKGSSLTVLKSYQFKTASLKYFDI